MVFKFLFLPPLADAHRSWARKLAGAFPDIEVVLAEDQSEAEREIADADGAAGTISPDLLPKCRKLRWLQSHYAAPPTGYYYPELIAHPVTVTNMREIFNDHIGAHVMAYVLAFARGLHYYIPQQLRREWRPARKIPVWSICRKPACSSSEWAGSAARWRGLRKHSA